MWKTKDSVKILSFKVATSEGSHSQPDSWYSAPILILCNSWNETNALHTFLSIKITNYQMGGTELVNGLKLSTRKRWSYWRNWRTTWCDRGYFDLGVTLPGKPSTGSGVVKLLCVLPRLSLAPHDDKQLLSRHTVRTIDFLCLSQRVRRQRQKFNIATTIKSETFSSVACYSEMGVLYKVAGRWRQGTER